MSTSTLAASRTRSGALSLALDYIELTKPRIAVLVLVVVVASAVMAAWTTGSPVSGWAVFHACLGTLLVAGSASAANQWLEIRRDARMNRTADRPLPAGRISSFGALAFTTLTLSAGLTYLALTLPPSATLWAVLTWLLYVAVYTPLKPISSANTVVGAVAGALPVFIGWSAVSESLDIRAVALFLTIYLWQFPHFMAIAWMYREDYARAGYLVLPRGSEEQMSFVNRQTLLPLLALLPVTLLPFFACRATTLYYILASLLSSGFLHYGAQFVLRRSSSAARRLLAASIFYLPLLFVLMVISRASRI